MTDGAVQTTGEREMSETMAVENEIGRIYHEEFNGDGRAMAAHILEMRTHGFRPDDFGSDTCDCGRNIRSVVHRSLAQ